MLYEINYLVLQSKFQDLEKTRSFMKELIANAGGEVKEEKEFLKRKLAYQINKESYGFHTVLRFETEDAKKCLDEMEKGIKMNQEIARHIVVRAQEMISLKEMFSVENQKKDLVRPEDLKKIMEEEKNKKIKKVKEEKEKTEKAEVLAEENEASEKLAEKEEKEISSEEEVTEEIEKTDEKDAKEEKIENKETKKSEAEEKEKPVEKKEKKANKKGDLDLDDLDKKLDELLDI